MHCSGPFLSQQQHRTCLLNVVGGLWLDTTTSLISDTDFCRPLLVASLSGPWRSCIALSLPMFHVVLCLKSPNVSRAVTRADMSVLLPSVIPLPVTMAIRSPGLHRGVGEHEGMTRGWPGCVLGSLVFGDVKTLVFWDWWAWLRAVEGGRISAHMKDRGLSCLGPFPESEGRARPSGPWKVGCGGGMEEPSRPIMK